MDIIYSVVVPVFNEELLIETTYQELKKVMDMTNKPYEIIFVNDGSRDNSLLKLTNICNVDKNIKLINFSRNFGHQIAITAGMDYAKGKAIVVIDADLQDPPSVILEMIKKWEEGYMVVYGKREKRLGESLFKKASASIFYRFLDSLTDIVMPKDVGDFRLIDRVVLDELKKLPEHNRYVRGIIAWLGFKQTNVSFVRNSRKLGETKYPLKKMLKLAFDGIVSFSPKPLKLATNAGVTTCFGSVVYLLYLFYKKFFTRKYVLGYSYILPISLLFNGIILICLGIIGEYIARIYDEVKGRPLYVVSSVVNL